MISPFNIISWLFEAITLLFTCLALGIAWNQTRVHLAWLIPLTLGQALALIGSLSSFFMISYMRSQQIPSSQIYPFLLCTQIIYGLSILVHTWFAVTLFMTLKSQRFASRQTGLPSSTDAWPPPPTS